MLSIFVICDFDLYTGKFSDKCVCKRQMFTPRTPTELRIFGITVLYVKTIRKENKLAVVWWFYFCTI